MIMRHTSIRWLCGCWLLACSGLLQSAAAETAIEAPPAQASTDRAAFDYLKAMADKGDPVGQFYLGALYAEGRGVPSQHKMAVALYTKAAQQDYAPAQFSLGLAYVSGLGVARDYAKAAKWWERAAKQNHAEAQYNLGGLHYYGLGVRRDERKAQKLFDSAAALGHAQAQRALAVLAALERSRRAPAPLPAATELTPAAAPTTTE